MDFEFDDMLPSRELSLFDNSGIGTYGGELDVSPLSRSLTMYISFSDIPSTPHCTNMHILTVALSGCLLAATASAQRADGQFWPCNPIKNDTGACPADPGLPTSTYSVDFTKKTSIPTNWMISNYANIPFGPLGAEFTYAKRYDAPQLWTDFFILFGKITIEARIANGTGMISSFVLISDDFDEIDFEFSGNNFGDTASRGKGQNNYFGKGITGNYDRGGWFDVVDPQGTFHTYEIEWTEERLVWRVDGVEVRRFLARDATTAKDSAYQFPQTPSKFQLGIWAGGDPGQNEGTKVRLHFSGSGS